MQLGLHDTVKNNHIVSIVTDVMIAIWCNDKLCITISTEKCCDIFRGLYKTATYIVHLQNKTCRPAHLSCTTADFYNIFD